MKRLFYLILSIGFWVVCFIVYQQYQAWSYPVFGSREVVLSIVLGGWFLVGLLFSNKLANAKEEFLLAHSTVIISFILLLTTSYFSQWFNFVDFVLISVTPISTEVSSWLELISINNFYLTAIVVYGLYAISYLLGYRINRFISRRIFKNSCKLV